MRRSFKVTWEGNRQRQLCENNRRCRVRTEGIYLMAGLPQCYHARIVYAVLCLCIATVVDDTNA